MAGSILPHSQFPLQIPGQAERSTWFQELVAAVSKQIKDGEKSAAEEYARKKNAAPENLSVEDEEALVDALEKQKKGEVTMEQAFRELSRNHDHTEREWNALFFSNYERLVSKVGSTSNHDGGRASADDRDSTGFSNLVASRTRSATINWGSHLSSSNGVTTVKTPTNSSEELESESESESASEWEVPLREGSPTLHDPDPSPTARDAAPQLRTRTRGPNSTKTPPRLTSWGTRVYTPVTEEDLRAMALYRWEKGDDFEISHYFRSRWREFAERPENHKRSPDAWHCVPRIPGHAAAIDRYVREYQLQAEVTDSKPVLPDLPPPRTRTQWGVHENYGVQGGKGNDEPENWNMASTSRAEGDMEIIDLTGEKEE